MSNALISPFISLLFLPSFSLFLFLLLFVFPPFPLIPPFFSPPSSSYFSFFSVFPLSLLLPLPALSFIYPPSFPFPSFSSYLYPLLRLHQQTSRERKERKMTQCKEKKRKTPEGTCRNWLNAFLKTFLNHLLMCRFIYSNSVFIFHVFFFLSLSFLSSLYIYIFCFSLSLFFIFFSFISVAS